VTRWLSDAWFEQARTAAVALAERPGLTARVQRQIIGGPDGDVACYWVLEDGRPTAAAIGAVDSPDVTLTLSWSDAAAIQSGSLDPSVAFMQGRMKVVGSMAVTMDLLQVAREPDGQALLRQMAAFTEY
jgi:putative sterol carrier protein